MGIRTFSSSKALGLALLGKPQDLPQGVGPQISVDSWHEALGSHLVSLIVGPRLPA